jgi:hypothetical protein
VRTTIGARGGDFSTPFSLLSSPGELVLLVLERLVLLVLERFGVALVVWSRMEVLLGRRAGSSCIVRERERERERVCVCVCV